MQSQKKAVNLRISNDLIIKSKKCGINLSRALEEKLIELLREKLQESWLSENQKAIDDYNEQVAKKGVFSDKLRRF